MTVLHYAAFHGQLAIVKEISNDLCEKNPAINNTNLTPLHEASKGGHLKIVRYFQEVLPDMSIPDSNGMNALHYAAKEGHNLVVKFLIETIPTDLQTKDGKTAKDLASCFGHESIAIYLQNLDRLMNETREESAIRRLENIHGKTYEMMILKIKNETEKELPTAIMTTVHLLSQSGWPSDINPCSDYNKEVCEKPTFHDNDMVHSCAICKLMLGASYFHPAKSCELLKKLDSGIISDETALPDIAVQRLSLWYDEKNDAWTKWSKLFGFYRVEKFLVKDKPTYTSEHEGGAYAVWYDENRNWAVGPSYLRGKKVWHCHFYAGGKVHSGGNDVCPTDTDYIWKYSANGKWTPAKRGFKIIKA